MSKYHHTEKERELVREAIAAHIEFEFLVDDIEREVLGHLGTGNTGKPETYDILEGAASGESPDFSDELVDSVLDEMKGNLDGELLHNVDGVPYTYSPRKSE